MNPARLISRIAPTSIDPRRERSDSSRPEWTVAEIAFSLSGLREPFASAIRWRWSRADDALPVLRGELLTFATWLAAREQWPQRIRTRDGERVAFPIDDLIDLALLEEHYQKRMTGAFMQALLGVTESIWRRRLRPPYEALRAELEDWNGIAYRHVRRRIQGES